MDDCPHIFMPQTLYEQVADLALVSPALGLLWQKDYAGEICLEVDVERLAVCRAMISRPTVGPVTSQLLKDAPRPFIIATLSKGLNHIEPSLQTDRQIRIIAPKDALGNGPAVAELTIWLAISLLRWAHFGSSRVERGIFSPSEFIMARRLVGATWVTVGSGAQVAGLCPLIWAHGANHLIIYNPRMDQSHFSAAVANLTSAFGERFLAANGKLNAVFPRPPGGFIIEGTQDEQMAFRQANILSLHLSGEARNYGYLNSDRLAWLRPDCIVVNMVRGELVDEQAVLAALKQKRIGGYGADVLGSIVESTGNTCYSPLGAAAMAQRDSAVRVNEALNILLTPHIGGSTADAIDGIAQTVIPQLLEELRVHL